MLNIPAITLPTITTIYTSSRDYIKTMYEVITHYWNVDRETRNHQASDYSPTDISLNDDRTDGKGKAPADHTGLRRGGATV